MTMVIDHGFTNVASLENPNDIFAMPQDRSALGRVTLASANATYKRGQIFKRNDTTGKYEAVADNTAFADIVDQLGILLNDITLAGADAYAVLQYRGNFIQERLTPNNIPLGAYACGNIIIEEETA